MHPRSGPTGGRLQLIGYGTELPRWADDLELTVAEHRGAIALPLRTRARARLLGAVYDRGGRVLIDSERAKSNRAWAGNPSRLPDVGKDDAQRLYGRTFFGGHLRHAFGHVMLEVMPRFWPALDYAGFDHVLFYPTRMNGGSDPIPPYATDLLAALGVRPESLIRIAGRPMVCAELTVTTPPFWLQRAVHPAFLDPFERALDCFAGTGPPPAAGRRIYLSRSRLPHHLRRATNEAVLEAMLVEVGFHVLHPQEMTIAEQALAVRQADALAGCDGSALHLAAFARPGTVLLSVDSRPVVNQFMIDSVRGMDAVHVLAAKTPVSDRTVDWVADLSLVREGLVAAALV